MLLVNTTEKCCCVSLLSGEMGERERERGGNSIPYLFFFFLPSVAQICVAAGAPSLGELCPPGTPQKETPPNRELHEEE